MKPIKSFFYAILFLTILLASCSVEKRHYTSGYHLQWKHAVKSESPKEVIAKSTQENKTVEIKKLSEQKTSFTNNIDALIASAKKEKRILLFPDSTACDTLILRNETEIKVKVTEITPTEIKYKHCNNLTGPTYVVYRYEVSYIKYANGSLDSFINEHAPAQNTNRDNDRYNPNFNGGYSRGANRNAATDQYVRTRSMASLVLGIASFPLLYIGVGVITAIIAIVLARKSLRLIKQDPQNLYAYKKRAIAGLVLGWIITGFLLLIALIFLIALIIVLSGI